MTTITYTFESYSETQGDWEMDLEVDVRLPYGCLEDPHFVFEIMDVRRTDGKPFDEVPERHQNIREYLRSYLQDDDDFLEAAAKRAGQTAVLGESMGAVDKIGGEHAA